MIEAPSLDLFRRVVVDPLGPGVSLAENLRDALCSTESGELLIPSHLVKAVSMGARVEMTGTRSIIGQTAFLYRVELNPIFYAADYNVVFVRNDQAEISYLAANIFVAEMKNRPYFDDQSWSILVPVRAILENRGLTIDQCSVTYNRNRAIYFYTTLSAWNAIADKTLFCDVFDQLVADYHAITYQNSRPAQFSIVANDVILHAATFN